MPAAPFVVSGTNLKKSLAVWHVNPPVVVLDPKQVKNMLEDTNSGFSLCSNVQPMSVHEPSDNICSVPNFVNGFCVSQFPFIHAARRQVS